MMIYGVWTNFEFERGRFGGQVKHVVRGQLQSKRYWQAVDIIDNNMLMKHMISI